MIIICLIRLIVIKEQDCTKATRVPKSSVNFCGTLQPRLVISHLYRHSEIQSVVLEVLRVFERVMGQCRVGNEFRNTPAIANLCILCSINQLSYGMVVAVFKLVQQCISNFSNKWPVESSIILSFQYGCKH